MFPLPRTATRLSNPPSSNWSYSSSPNIAQKVTLTPPQSRIWRSPARFKMLVAGRRFGKTTLADTKLYYKACLKSRQYLWYVAPTYRMAKRIAWDALKALVPKKAIAFKHETELTIGLVNGSKISLFGADNPDSLRGSGIDGVVIDEFALIRPEVWFEIIRPALADKMGWADMLFTPKGMNFAYDLLKEAEGKDDWEIFQYTTAQGGNVSPAELEDAKASMDIRVYRQEFEASFETLAGRIFDNFERVANIDPTLIDTGAEILVGMDFNVNPMTAVIAVHVADECHVLDCLQIMTSNTEEMAKEINKRYPNRTIIIYPDPSGKARKTSAPVGVTDFSILKSAGFRVVAPNQAPLVVDRNNAVQAMLCDAKGRRRLLIHPRAKVLIKSFEGFTYKEGTSIPDKDSGLDHPADAIAYLIWSRFNLLKGSGWERSGVQVY